MKKILSLIIPALALAFIISTNTQAANVTALDTQVSGTNITVSGTVEASVVATTIEVYDYTGTNLLYVKTTGVTDSNTFSDTIAVANNAYYLVKVADYAGGDYKTANVTVGNPNVAVTGVTLDKTSVTLNPKKTTQLTATVEPANATNQAVKWSTNKKDVATVDANGKVTAKAAGTAKITATTVDGSKTAICTVKVRGLSLSDSKLTVQKDKTNKKIEATVTNDTLKKATSKNSKIATAKLDKNKVVIKGIKKGSTTVTVTTKGGLSQTIKVTVQQGKVKTTKLTVKKNKANVKVGKKVTVQATATPDKVSTGDKIKVSSDNKKIAKVSIDSNGLITIKGVKKGKATITVKAGSKTQKIKITVKK